MLRSDRQPATEQRRRNERHEGRQLVLDLAERPQLQVPGIQVKSLVQPFRPCRSLFLLLKLVVLALEHERADQPAGAS
eukprot:331586-Chlamydomonas_euryale.AAC.2